MSTNNLKRVSRTQAEFLIGLRQRFSLHEKIGEPRTTADPWQMQYRSIDDSEPSGYWHAAEYDLVAFTAGRIFQSTNMDSFTGEVSVKRDWFGVALEFYPSMRKLFHYEHFDKNARLWVYTAPVGVRLTPDNLARVIVSDNFDPDLINRMLDGSDFKGPIAKFDQIVDPEGIIDGKRYYHRLGLSYNLGESVAIRELADIIWENHLLCSNMLKQREQLLESISQHLFHSSFNKLDEARKSSALLLARAVLYKSQEEFVGLIGQ